MDVGVVGLGVVGSATAKLLSLAHTVHTFDINGTGTVNTIRELGERVEVAFVCVPTPTGLVNRLDVSIVRQVCRDLENACVVAVRSTVPVGTCRKLPGRVVYNPEFCNARTAYEDMVAAERIVIGGEDADAVRAVIRVYYDGWATAARPVLASWEDAEALKLVTNVAMTARIAFANEAKAVVEHHGADWGRVSYLLAHDGRLGHTGWQVPGPDGKPGFGGACLPKDLLGFLAQATDARLVAPVTEAARSANRKLRPEGK